MGKKQVWLIVIENDVKSVVRTLENLLRTVTAHSDGLSDGSGNPVVVLTLDEEELSQACEYLNGKEDMRLSCVKDSGIFENNERKPWPEEKSTPSRVGVDIAVQNKEAKKNSMQAYLNRHKN